MTGHHGYVLIVDDEPDIREALAELLVESGYDVKLAANGRDALELLGVSALPSLILLDVMMPIMDGIEFCRHKRRDPNLSGIPVCFVTASEPPPTLLGRGIPVLRKPIDTSALLSLVDRHC